MSERATFRAMASGRQYYERRQLESEDETSDSEVEDQMPVGKSSGRRRGSDSDPGPDSETLRQLPSEHLLRLYTTGREKSTDRESGTRKHKESSTSKRQTPRTVIHSAMMPSEIAQVLEVHGCENLTYKLDPSACSTFPLFSGGLGDVYLGKLDGTKVAIKTTRLHIVNQDKKHLKHAARELHTWSKCQHPNVLRLLGFVEFRGQVGMVSRWISNGNVQTYLKERPETDRCEMCHHISDGLAYLHDSGIIHGDLKGANVLVSDDGAPMLADFGNSVLRDQSLQLTQTTIQTNISPRWTASARSFAPEILEGSTSYSYAADVYALGMTFLEVITGNVPFHELHRDQAVYTAIVIRRKIPDRPVHIPRRSTNGDDLWSLLKKCWMYESSGRPTARDVQEQIKCITADGLSERVYSEEETSSGGEESYSRLARSGGNVRWTFSDKYAGH